MSPTTVRHPGVVFRCYRASTMRAQQPLPFDCPACGYRQHVRLNAVRRLPRICCRGCGQIYSVDDLDVREAIVHVEIVVDELRTVMRGSAYRIGREDGPR